MEVNTVVLSIDSYNELRDFRKGIEEGNTLYISYGFCSYEKKYITTDEAVKNILSINKALEAQINEFRINEFQISKIKKMSIWEFIKWRKS